MPAYRTTVGPFAKLKRKPATDKAVKLTPAQEAARIDALMEKGKSRMRGSAARPAVAAVAPKTPAQIRSENAARLRGKLMPGFLGPLQEALTPKKKKGK